MQACMQSGLEPSKERRLSEPKHHSTGTSGVLSTAEESIDPESRLTWSEMPRPIAEKRTREQASESHRWCTRPTKVLRTWISLIRLMQSVHCNVECN